MLAFCFPRVLKLHVRENVILSFSICLVWTARKDRQEGEQVQEKSCCATRSVVNCSKYDDVERNWLIGWLGRFVFPRYHARVCAFLNSQCSSERVSEWVKLHQQARGYVWGTRQRSKESDTCGCWVEYRSMACINGLLRGVATPRVVKTNQGK